MRPLPYRRRCAPNNGMQPICSATLRKRLMPTVLSLLSPRLSHRPVCCRERDAIGPSGTPPFALVAGPMTKSLLTNKEKRP